MKIMLSDFENINEFSSGIQFFEGNIDVKQDHRIINARSFLQLCSLNLSRPIDVEIECEYENVKQDFYNYIKKWEVE